MVRREGYKPTKALWVFCEGKCEKQYFSKLKFVERISRLKIKPIEVGHKNADGIIQDAIDYINKKRDFQKDDLVVCVFDRDANTNEQLEKAKSLAKKHNIIISFSNPCFEYWFLCHYGYFPSAYEKDTIDSKIKEFFLRYNKNDSDLYLKTKDKIKDAIINAKRIKEEQLAKKKDLISKKSNPLSLVFELIQLIDKFKD